MIRFACPGCQQTFNVEDAKAGKTGNCPKCQTQFIIPQAEAGASPPPPSSSEPVEIDPCPKCQTRLSVSVSDIGNDVECPYCKTVFRAAKAGSRPPVPPPAPPKRSDLESTDDTGRPKRKRDDEDDDRPRRRGRRDDDDVEEVKPKSRRRSDDDDDEDERPRSRRRSGRSGGGRSGTMVISRVGVLSMGKISGITSFCMTMIILLPVALITMMTGAAQQNAGGGPGAGPAAGILGLGGCMLLVLPFFYAIGGFIGGCIYAFIYNIMASMVGGIEMDLDDA